MMPDVEAHSPERERHTKSKSQMEIVLVIESIVGYQGDEKYQLKNQTVV